MRVKQKLRQQTQQKPYIYNEWQGRINPTRYGKLELLNMRLTVSFRNYAMRFIVMKTRISTTTNEVIAILREWFKDC